MSLPTSPSRQHLKMAKVEEMFELVIGKNLSWLDDLQKVYEKKPNYSVSSLISERVN